MGHRWDCSSDVRLLGWEALDPPGGKLGGAGFRASVHLERASSAGHGDPVVSADIPSISAGSV